MRTDCSMIKLVTLQYWVWWIGRYWLPGPCLRQSQPFWGNRCQTSSSSREVNLQDGEVSWGVQALYGWQDSRCKPLPETWEKLTALQRMKTGNPTEFLRVPTRQSPQPQMMRVRDWVFLFVFCCCCFLNDFGQLSFFSFQEHFIFFNSFFKRYIYLFYRKTRACQRKGQRDRERIPSRLPAAVVTRAKIKSLT